MNNRHFRCGRRYKILLMTSFSVRAQSIYILNSVKNLVLQSAVSHNRSSSNYSGTVNKVVCICDTHAAPPVSQNYCEFQGMHSWQQMNFAINVSGQLITGEFCVVRFEHLAPAYWDMCQRRKALATPEVCERPRGCRKFRLPFDGNFRYSYFSLNQSYS